jgi:hypothetical protein
MRYAIFFAGVAGAVWAFREVLTRKGRRRAITSAAGGLIPLLVALVATCALLFFNLNFNGKII